MQNTTSNKILKNHIKNNENNNNIQYTSFRKANNNEILIRQRNLFKIKKSNMNINNKNYLTLKDIPNNMSKTKSNINYNNTSKRIYINEDLSTINKTNKNKKNNCNKNSNPKKVIFDYKKK